MVGSRKAASIRLMFPFNGVLSSWETEARSWSLYLFVLSRVIRRFLWVVSLRIRMM